MTDEEMMRLAISKAMEGITSGQTPFGAVITKDGEVVTAIHNAVWKDTDPTAHAEIVAIRDASKKLGRLDLSGCIIYSTCEPCPMCFTACHWARISKIIYGARIDDAKGYGFNELTISNEEMKRLGGSGVEIVGDILREEALEAFRVWFANPDRKVY